MMKVSVTLSANTCRTEAVAYAVAAKLMSGACPKEARRTHQLQSSITEEDETSQRTANAL